MLFHAGYFKIDRRKVHWNVYYRMERNVWHEKSNKFNQIDYHTDTHTHTSTSINGSRESNTNNKYRDLESVRYQSEWHISQMQKAEIANAILRPFLPLMYSFRSHKHTHTFINRLSFEIKMIIRFGPKQPNELNECKSDKVETRT